MLVKVKFYQKYGSPDDLENAVCDAARQIGGKINWYEAQTGVFTGMFEFPNEQQGQTFMTTVQAMPKFAENRDKYIAGKLT